MDRASGSGVFARDPDAQLDMIELELSEDVRNTVAEAGATAWRMESSLREFKSFTPIDFWFEYPIHRMERGDTLSEMPPLGSPEAGRLKNRFHKSAKHAAEEFRTAFQMENMDGNGVTVKSMAAHLGLAERTIRNRIERLNGEFVLRNGIIQELKNTN